jgi:hypothetical protein
MNIDCNTLITNYEDREMTRNVESNRQRTRHHNAVEKPRELNRKLTGGLYRDLGRRKSQIDRYRYTPRKREDPRRLKNWHVVEGKARVSPFYKTFAEAQAEADRLNGLNQKEN